MTKLYNGKTLEELMVIFADAAFKPENKGGEGVQAVAEACSPKYDQMKFTALHLAMHYIPDHEIKVKRAILKMIEELPQPPQQGDV